jgi:hypothetical protein
LQIRHFITVREVVQGYEASGSALAKVNLQYTADIERNLATAGIIVRGSELYELACNKGVVTAARNNGDLPYRLHCM